MAYHEYLVDRRQSGQRLREFLAERLAVSGRQAKQLLDRRDVSVNGRRVWMAGHVLKAGDCVGVLQGPAATPAGAKASPPAARRVVLYEDPDFRVIDKPPGVETVGPDSLEARLQAEPGGRDDRAAHRLDRDTSGCLLVARNAAAFEAMIPLFRQQLVAKEYRAIVAGRFTGPPRTIQTPLDGERAESWVQGLGGGEAASQVRIRIATGRTHQIRRHLAGIHFPVLGDRQYGPHRGLDARLMKIPRQMLHAFSIRLPHPLREGEIRAQAPLPPDFRQCLRTFGLSDRR